MRAMMAWPAGRVTKWIVLVAWLAVVGAAGPVAGKVWTVANDETVSWLPRGAESTEVVQLQERFTSGDRIPAVVVYHRDGGVTEADRALAERHYQQVAARHLDGATPPGGQGPPVVASEDGEALMYAIPVSFDGAEGLEEPGKIVESIRETVGGGAGGLDVKVTGPAGFLGDFTGAFAGFDTTILLVTISVVALLLLLIYRSPVLWLIPLLAVGLASQVGQAGVYWLVDGTGLTANSANIFVLTVLVFGAGTDYALLLVARYREELRRHHDKHEAMATALRGAGPAILASAATVSLGMLCLLAADLNTNRSLGPVGAVGIVSALLAMLTLLPAVLVILGRWVFWPFVPHYGSAVTEQAGMWSRAGQWIARRPRRVWAGTALVLAVLAVGVVRLDTTLTQAEQFRTRPESIEGQELMAAHFAAGASDPAVVVAGASAAAAVTEAAAATPGVAAVEPAGQAGDLVQLRATLEAAPGSAAEADAVERLRDRVHAVPGADALVGGSAAQTLDLNRTIARDQQLIMPLVLLVVLLILALLLRSVVAPLLLLATVVLSFGAALGISSVLFRDVLGFGGVDPGTPLSAFIFLVALGVDYNIFLMSRVREEAERHGTRAGTLTGLAVTGGVITSAGIVLAATFSVLTVLPLVATLELGVAIAIGVLLDTLVVRSILVPALSLDVDRRLWWPSRLARRSVEPRAPEHVLAASREE